MSKKALYATVIGAFVAGAGAQFAVTHVLAADQAYEKQAGGGGAPEKVLLDNDKVRVNLVSFPKGFERPGNMKRRYDQLLVYIDPGDFSFVQHSDGSTPDPKQEAGRKPLEPGHVTFHGKDTVV